METNAPRPKASFPSADSKEHTYLACADKITGGTRYSIGPVRQGETIGFRLIA